MNWNAFSQDSKPPWKLSSCSALKTLSEKSSKAASAVFSWAAKKTARLSFMNLPTPNLFTGGENFHGKFEFVSIDVMNQAVGVVVGIANAFSQLKSNQAGEKQ